jgi:hypothetical protein
VSINLYFEIQNLLAQQSPSPSEYILQRDEDGVISTPRNLIEVGESEGRSVPTIGIVIDL